MWMCEFAQDLFYRLVGKNVHFRGMLTIGDFAHTIHTNIEAFYGQALVATYNYEKNVVCMGLLMDNNLVKYSDIFKTSPYDASYHFVHIMQTLERISFEEGEYPFDPILLYDNENLHAYDFVYLRNIYSSMT